jgi:hypothetical protein
VLRLRSVELFLPVPYISMTWCLIKLRDNVTFLLTAFPPKCRAVKGLTKKGDIQKSDEWKQYKGQHSPPLNQSMQIARSSETWVTLFQTMHRHITDDSNLQKGICFLIKLGTEQINEVS